MTFLYKTKHFFPSFEENGVIKNYVTRLIRRRKWISMTQNYFYNLPPDILTTLSCVLSKILTTFPIFDYDDN